MMCEFVKNVGKNLNPERIDYKVYFQKKMVKHFLHFLEVLNDRLQNREAGRGNSRRDL